MKGLNHAFLTGLYNYVHQRPTWLNKKFKLSCAFHRTFCAASSASVLTPVVRREPTEPDHLDSWKDLAAHPTENALMVVMPSEDRCMSNRMSHPASSGPWPSHGSLATGSSRTSVRDQRQCHCHPLHIARVGRLYGKQLWHCTNTDCGVSSSQSCDAKSLTVVACV